MCTAAKQVCGIEQGSRTQCVAEVRDFVEFLAAREQRVAAGARLSESLARLDALDLPPLR